MKNSDTQRHGLQRNAQEQPEQEFDLASLVPLGERLIENQRHVSDNQLQVAKLQYEAQQHRDSKTVEDRSDARRHERFRFQHFFWYVVFFSVVICLFAAGLMFLLHEVQTGVLLLTHFIAFGTGIAAGLGIRPKPRQAVDAENSN